MKVRDLLLELLKEDIDSDVYAKYTDDEGNDVFFSMDGLAMNSFKSKFGGECPTIILDDAQRRLNRRRRRPS